jgi:hypothetical protein
MSEPPDVQDVRDRALIDRPESVAIQFVIEDSGLGDLAANEVEQLPDLDIRWIVPRDHLPELIRANPYTETPLKPGRQNEQVNSHGCPPPALPCPRQL